MHYPVIATIFACCLIRAGHATTNVTFPNGDPRLCLNNLLVNGPHRYIGRLEVLPGSGWDNLRNVPMGSVLTLNYSQCRTTDDGRFLIPDSMNVYPVKTSRVDSFAEIIDNWNDYTAATSRSINSNLGFQGVFDISGTFADEYVYSKSRQIEDNSITTRVQERYVRYRVVVQPDMPIDPGFKYRLLTIAASLELNDTYQARFDTQQLVREFGTHVTTSVDAGAAIVQEEQVSEDITKVKGYSRSSLKSAARFSFASQVGLFWAGLNSQSSQQSSFNTVYMQNRTESLIRAVGVAIVNRTNFTREQWTDMIDKDLVAIDREGEPIFSFITAQTLPEVPASTLMQMAAMVEEAVTSYYKVNTYPGCTDKTAGNFCPRSNVDDGSCHPPDVSSLVLGGVYQTCNHTKTDAGDLCDSLTQNNPSTGQTSCPDGFEAVFLLSGTKTHNAIDHVCKSCWLIFGHCCRDEVRTSSAHYEAYWCAAMEDTEEEEQQETRREAQKQAVAKTDGGYMFGGIFTSHIANAVTSAMSCPHAFVSLRLADNMHVCVSDQYSSATENAVPFAGFYSCQSGNPLALRSGPNVSLANHMYTQGPAHWPRRCPIGYSSFMADITPREGCEVNYCIQSGSLKSKKLPSLRRPPFIQPPIQPPNPLNQFVFDQSQNLWQKNAQVRNKSLASGDWSTLQNMADDDAILIAVIAFQLLLLFGIVLLTVMTAALVARMKNIDRKKYKCGSCDDNGGNYAKKMNFFHGTENPVDTTFDEGKVC